MSAPADNSRNGYQAGWSSTTMTGTTKVTSEWLEVPAGASSLTFQTTHTGTATGAYIVEVSNDPAADASKVATLHPSADTVVAAVSAAGTQVVRAEKVFTKFARLAYTNATNTGTLTTNYVFAK